MAKVLAILANPRKNSHTLRLLRGFLTAYSNHHPDDEIAELDLYCTDIPVIDNAVLQAWSKQETERTLAEKRLLEPIHKLTEQFITADKIVFAAPMWNLQFPPLLTAYFSNVAVAGKTFRYTEQGWEGLAGDKPVLLIHVRGGVFSHGPAQPFDHAVPYLRSMCQFLGMNDFRIILCEGIEMYPDRAEKIFEQAMAQAIQLAEKF